MSSKNWIMIKRGLSESPKHRERMGECIWLFMHIIDRTDWETGICYGWKDKYEAEAMGMPVRTLRWQREKLESLVYITCKKSRHDQDIIVHNWTNPRNYSGKVLNSKSGNELPVSENESGNESGNESSSRIATPTSKSGNHLSGDQGCASTTRAIQARYEELLGYKLDDWASGESKAAKAIAEKWTPDQLEAAYKHYKAQPFYSDKRLTLGYLKKQMPELFKDGNGNGQKPAWMRGLERAVEEARTNGDA